ncbi:hypothetical protein [Rhizobium leguminosarum]|uniref:hypothetical protein n=1 Tax=Rhizobium leguminosarum TaxID=384 RepID=UPI001427DAC6|nr:hypothetical protein [Rhizobium leguminosarum]
MELIRGPKPLTEVERAAAAYLHQQVKNEILAAGIVIAAGELQWKNRDSVLPRLDKRNRWGEQMVDRQWTGHPPTALDPFIAPPINCDQTKKRQTHKSTAIAGPEERRARYFQRGRA